MSNETKYNINDIRAFARAMHDENPDVSAFDIEGESPRDIDSESIRQVMAAIEYQIKHDGNIAGILYDYCRERNVRVFGDDESLLEFHRSIRGEDFGADDLKKLMGPSLYKLECGLWLDLTTYDPTQDLEKNPPRIEYIQAGDVNNTFETSPYVVRTPPGMTVGELIREICRVRPREHGAIYIEKGPDPLKINRKTIAACPYKYGKAERDVKPEIADMKIVSVTACGGWSYMGYYVLVDA